ncbi:MAG: hypothetical protein AAF399_21250 [Bacteroidota bacterium]
MPLVEYYFPQTISPARLDRHWAGGWFRSGGALFRSRVLCMEGGLYSVVNIRVKLEGYQMSRSLRKIWRKNQTRFQVETGPASVGAAQERLYQEGKGKFKGYIFETLEEFLYSRVPKGLFNTHEIRVYEGEKLVAASYFDLGEAGIGSILGLYDSAYSNFSLGIYTMLLEVFFAQERGCRFYYPGYILRGTDAFDYKLRLGHIQYHNWHGRWKSLETLQAESLPTEELDRAFSSLTEALREADIPHSQHLYPPFSLAYLDRHDQGFLGSPTFIYCYPDHWQDDLLLIEYELESGEYVLNVASKDETSLDYTNGGFSEDFFGEDPFERSLLIREDQIIRTTDQTALIQQILQVGPPIQKDWPLG